MLVDFVCPFSDEQVESLGKMFEKILIMRFQKISVPAPKKVTGNSEGVGGFKNLNL